MTDQARAALDALLRDVRKRLAERGLSASAAAEEIGVTPGSLERHLDGAYVRSDSAAKYRSWLGGGRAPSRRRGRIEPPKGPGQDQREALAEASLVQDPRAPERPWNVVDIFSGCGGLSLGFELHDGGRTFRSVLAIDIDAGSVRAWNDNFPPAATPGLATCRRVDLADFRSETEVLAFYLDHLAARTRDDDLARRLDALPVLGLPRFKRLVAELDAWFLAELADAWGADAWREIDATALGQTAVVGFHDALALPPRSSLPPSVAPHAWWDDEREARLEPRAIEDMVPLAGLRATRSRLDRLWRARAGRLRSMSGDGRGGRGQLAASSSRIGAFVTFLESGPMRLIRARWLDWRTARDSLRASVFGNERVRAALLDAYAGERRVSVVLGGPPCQGFSRIGRGKIRSLREQNVHAQYDDESGDERNRLLLKYVQFVAALAPRVFLFENVRHFQAEVRTPDGSFLATDLLAEAIRSVSRRGLAYRVASRTLLASDHLVPQTRERFFMVGVREDGGADPPIDPAGWCLAVRRQEVVPAAAALDGLPEPHDVNALRHEERRLSRTVATTLAAPDGPGPGAAFARWIRQPAPPWRDDRDATLVDAHHIRPPRADDAGIFGLLGPGKRWMDYRCDQSQTLLELREALETLSKAVAELGRSSAAGRHPALRLLRTLKPERVARLVDAADGSLSLRLLLECIEPLPGEPGHHLLAPAYLAKREGHHGDWLARLHADRPSKTIVSHMGKDTYGYVHPFKPRTLSVREAARLQTFPDWFRFGSLGLVEAFRAIGNAVPPLLSHQLACRVAQVLQSLEAREPSCDAAAAST